MLMQMGGIWFIGADEFKITPGTKTNTTRSLSGKVWSRRTLYRDTLVISLTDKRHRDYLAIWDWLYANSAKGELDDKDAFSMYLERQEPLMSVTNNGRERGFRGVVRWKDSSTVVPLDKFLIQNTTLTFEIISYENL